MIPIPTSEPARNTEWLMFFSKLARILFLDSVTTAAGAGADGTISSRSANALGECDGFVKMELGDGTIAYIPYWEDIAP